MVNAIIHRKLTFKMMWQDEKKPKKYKKLCKAPGLINVRVLCLINNKEKRGHFQIQNVRIAIENGSNKRKINMLMLSTTDKVQWFYKNSYA